MKKHLLFGIAISIGTIGIAQNSSTTSGKSVPTLKPAIANKTVLARKRMLDTDSPSFQAVVHNDNSHHQNAFDSRSSTEHIIGTSIYDLQTNAAVCNRIVLNADGTIAATWTMSHDGDAETSPNRGTGYNYFNGTTWGTAPTTRLETVRCGWPNIGVTNTGGEVIVSHEATSSVGNIHVLTRPVKGTGSWHDTTLGYPDVWPRMVIGGANGHTIHVISQTTGASTNGNAPYHGQDGAIAYSRSLDGGITWDKYHTVIPEIDSSHYLGFGGDSYAMDAKGDTIVIVAGGFTVDVVLLKSTNNGASWTKTIVKQFPIPMYSSDNSTTDVDNDGVVDTIETNDASVAVLLDKQGKAHVWYGRMRVTCDNPGTGTGAGLSYFPGTDGLNYWNESMTTPGICAFAQDINSDGQLNVTSWGTYNASLTSMPSAGIDDAGRIYLSYGSIYEGITNDGSGPPSPAGKSFRHTYLLRSSDGGATWCGPIDVVDPDNSSTYDYLEGVFGAISRHIDNKAHLIYQRDSSPGHAAYGGTDVDPQSGESDIVYVELPVTDFDALPCDSLIFTTLSTLGVKENNDILNNVNLYPNPATNAVNLIFNLSKFDKVNVTISSIVGQELSNFEQELSSGSNSLTINLANYKPGVYLVKSTVQGKTVTKKLVVE
jgi:hypothetical protein